MKNSYVWGFGSLRFGGSFSYVWGLVFLCLGMKNSYVWGFGSLRFGG